MSVSELETCLDRERAVAAEHSDLTHFRQPIGVSLVAGARAAAGLGLVGLLTAGLAPGAAVLAVLGGIGGVFVWYGCRVVRRHMSVISLNDAGIASSGWPANMGSVAIRWAEVDGVSLRYFSTRRDRENGWAELVVHAGRSRIALESEHPAFEIAVRRALLAAARNGVSLSRTTLANAAALRSSEAANGNKT